MTDLGQFTHQVNGWRKLMASCRSVEDLVSTFHDAVEDVAGLLPRGLDRGSAAEVLMQMAEAYGLFGNLGEDQDSIESIIRDEFERIPPPDPDPDPDLDPRPQPKPRKPKNRARLTFKQLTEIILSTRPNYSIKSLLPRTGLAVIWGPPKCGKSFLAFDMAMHIALGWEYRNHRVQQGTVVYCALEGGGGFASRVEAWRRRKLNGQVNVPFYLLDVPLDFIAEQDQLIAAIRKQVGTPTVIFIDTLNRALVGDENKSEDMAKMIRAADLVRVSFGCLVVLIHHCGIATNRPRGHTSLAAADDAQIAVTRDDGGIIVCRVEWMKDGDTAAPMASRLESVDLGLDDDGDCMSSCVVVPTKMPKKEPTLKGAAKVAYDQLLELTSTDGIRSNPDIHYPANVFLVSAILWREHFYASYAVEKPDARQKAFVRASTTLLEKHLVGMWSDKVWLVDAPDKPDIGRTL